MEKKENTKQKKGAKRSREQQEIGSTDETRSNMEEKKDSHQPQQHNEATSSNDSNEVKGEGGNRSQMDVIPEGSSLNQWMNTIEADKAEIKADKADIKARMKLLELEKKAITFLIVSKTMEDSQAYIDEMLASIDVESNRSEVRRWIVLYRTRPDEELRARMNDLNVDLRSLDQRLGNLENTFQQLIAAAKGSSDSESSVSPLQESVKRFVEIILGKEGNVRVRETELEEIGATVIDFQTKIPFALRKKEIKQTKLLVRYDYKKLYDEIHSRWFGDEPRFDNFLVVGTPGIGKSQMLIYFAYRLLLEKDPQRIIFYSHPDGPTIVFHPEGKVEAFLNCNKDLIERLAFDDQNIWLMDQKEHVEGNPPCRTILCCSPNKRNFNEFKKVATTLYMPLWDYGGMNEAGTVTKELEALWRLNFSKPANTGAAGETKQVKAMNTISYEDLVQSFYYNGPIPLQVFFRINTATTTKEFRFQVDSLNIELNNMSLENVMNDIINKTINFETTSFALSYNGDHDNYYLFTVDFSSRYARDHYFQKSTPDQIRTLWEDFRKNLQSGQSSHVVGTKFEILAHHILPWGIELDSAALLHPSRPAARNRRASQISGTLKIPRLPKVLLYDNRFLKDLRPEHYGEMRRTNNPAIDAAWLRSDKRGGRLTLFMFQYTVSESHGYNAKALRAIIELMTTQHGESISFVLCLVVPRSIYDRVQFQTYTSSDSQTDSTERTLENAAGATRQEGREREEIDDVTFLTTHEKLTQCKVLLPVDEENFDRTLVGLLRGNSSSSSSAVTAPQAEVPALVAPSGRGTKRRHE